jgi:hypothetical protein
VAGKYFRSTPGARPTERWLAARMDELAGHAAALGVSQPIGFVNRPATDPLRHPTEPVRADDRYQLDANHVLPTASWPAGTFAGYHAYPFRPEFLRREPGLLAGGDPDAAYLTALRRHHATMPTVVTEFGVPSSIGSAGPGALGRSAGGLTEQDAMRIDGDLLRTIADRGLAAGFLAGWADQWHRRSDNTAALRDSTRLRFWHDALTADQHFGLLAMDAAGSGAAEQHLVDVPAGWPARRAAARTDEAYLHLDVGLAASPPGTLLVGFDVLPGVTGTPMVGSGDRRPDTVFALNLVGHTGQGYVREQLDPLAPGSVPGSARGPAPSGWRPYELLLRAGPPVELQNAGLLRHGTPESDSRALWHLDDDRLTVRVPWAMLGFADPSTRRVAVRRDGRVTTPVSPGVVVSLTASGTDQALGQVTWADWNRVGYTERLKPGAGQVRDAALSVTTG